MRPLDIILEPLDNERLANLCGALDENLRQIETAFDVVLARRGERFKISGSAVQKAAAALRHFYLLATAPLSIDEVQLGLIELARQDDTGQPGTLRA